MGGKQSSTKEPVDLYLDHPIFKNAKSLKIDDKNFMQVLVGTDEKQHKKWQKQLTDLKITNDYLLLPAKQQYSSKGLCGSSGTLKINFDSYPYLLSQQIYNRRGKKKGFQQCEIWYLLYALANAKKDMNPVFSKIGDVRPHNIFINDKGQIKVSNRYSWPKQSLNTDKALDGEVTYLAPEQIKQLELGKLDTEHNDRSEIFSIGLTLLSAALLEDYSRLYNIKNFTLDLHAFKQELHKLNSSPAFSDIMKGTINNLLELNVEKRLLPTELWTWISQYDRQILSRQNFIINQAPDKLHQQVAEIRSHYGGHINHNTTPVKQIIGSGYSGQKPNFPPPEFLIQDNYNGPVNTRISNEVVSSSYTPMVQGYPGGPVNNRISSTNEQVKNVNNQTGK